MLNQIVSISLVVCFASACASAPGLGPVEPTLTDLQGRWVPSGGDCSQFDYFDINGEQIRFADGTSASALLRRSSLRVDTPTLPLTIVFENERSGAVYQGFALRNAVVKCVYTPGGVGWVKSTPPV